METITTVLLPWTMAIKTEKKKEDQEGGANGFGTLFFGIIAIALGLFAAILCWRCNKNEDMGLRVIYTGLAFANAIPYLIYYGIIRTILGYDCKCCGGISTS